MVCEIRQWNAWDCVTVSQYPESQECNKVASVLYTSFSTPAYKNWGGSSFDEFYIIFSVVCFQFHNFLIFVETVIFIGSEFQQPILFQCW